MFGFNLIKLGLSIFFTFFLCLMSADIIECIFYGFLIFSLIICNFFHYFITFLFEYLHHTADDLLCINRLHTTSFTITCNLNFFKLCAIIFQMLIDYHLLDLFSLFEFFCNLKLLGSTVVKLGAYIIKFYCPTELFMIFSGFFDYIEFFLKDVIFSENNLIYIGERCLTIFYILTLGFDPLWILLCCLYVYIILLGRFLFFFLKIVILKYNNYVKLKDFFSNVLLNVYFFNLCVLIFFYWWYWLTSLLLNLLLQDFTAVVVFCIKLSFLVFLMFCIIGKTFMYVMVLWILFIILDLINTLCLFFYFNIINFFYFLLQTNLLFSEFNMSYFLLFLLLIISLLKFISAEFLSYTCTYIFLKILYIYWIFKCFFSFSLWQQLGYIFSYLIILFIFVAFITLLERKLLALIQGRQGPNIVGFQGLLQPFADALKLMQKEIILPSTSNEWLFIFSVFFAFIFSLGQWMVIPFFFSQLIIEFNLSFFATYVFSTLILLFFMFGAWASNSKYSFLGMERIMAQILSIEIPLGLIYLFFGYVIHTFNFLDLMFWQSIYISFVWFFLILFFLYYFLILAETNRHPIDLIEAESELVSGYNTEYSGLYFIFIYIAEYNNLLLFSVVITILFFKGMVLISFWNLFFFFSILWLIIMSILMLRAILPRIRYDQLMVLSWKFIMPILFLFFLLFVILTY